MTIKLLKWQQDFVDENPRKSILAAGMRCGKTYAMCFWAKNYPDTTFMLVCPKRLKGQWNIALRHTGVTNVTVLTKEEVKKVDLSEYTGLIADESHALASSLYEKPSQLTRTIYNWLREHEDAPVLLATATPIASKPANLHTLATFIGKRWDWKKFREKFYNLVRRPFAPHPFWEAKRNWRQLIEPLKQQVCYTIRLEDITYVPPQAQHVIEVPLKKETLQAIKDFADESPSKEWYGKHQLAQMQEKLSTIRELSSDEAKVIVVAKYKSQIAYYEKELSKDREVVVLTGDTKDQSEAIKRAHEMSEGYLIAQADTLEGFRGDTFNMMIYASLSWRYTSHVQSQGRMLHLDKQDGNVYYYLLADDKDKDIYQSVVVDTQDFSI